MQGAPPPARAAGSGDLSCSCPHAPCPTAQEAVRKGALEAIVRRATVAFDGTKSAAEIAEVRGAEGRGAAGGRARVRDKQRALSMPAPPPLRPSQRALRDPEGLMRDAVHMQHSEEAVAAYTEAQLRARDVRTLEGSLREVAGLFADLAVLVQHQSETLDSIGARAGRGVPRGVARYTTTRRGMPAPRDSGQRRDRRGAREEGQQGGRGRDPAPPADAQGEGEGAGRASTARSKDREGAQGRAGTPPAALRPSPRSATAACSSCSSSSSASSRSGPRSSSQGR